MHVALQCMEAEVSRLQSRCCFWPDTMAAAAVATARLLEEELQLRKSPSSPDNTGARDLGTGHSF